MSAKSKYIVVPRPFTVETPDKYVEKMDCGAKELETIRLSLAYASLMVEGLDSIRERLEMFPGAVKRWKTAATHMNAINHQILSSVPDKTYNRLRKEKDTHAWHFTPISVDTKFYSRILNSDIKVVTDQVIADNCALCLKERNEWRGCELRKAMMHICPPGEIDRKSPDCPYQTIARNCEYGDYMSTERKIIGNDKNDDNQAMRG